MLSLIKLCSLVAIEPYTDKWTHRIEIVNELTIWFICLFYTAVMFEQDSFDKNEYFRTNMGYCIIVS